MMANRIRALAIDCLDGDAQARFWCEVLGWQVIERDQFGTVSIAAEPDALVAIDFAVVPDGPKTVKNRLHLDVSPTDRDQDAELRRLLDIGAVEIDVGQGDATWRVLADPEGNEFCLLQTRLEP
ncbi:MAG: glyoxalase [Frankiales bacterium]|nr:glyoxalase [Frankiales bacterium]